MRIKQLNYQMNNMFLIFLNVFPTEEFTLFIAFIVLSSECSIIIQFVMNINTKNRAFVKTQTFKLFLF